MLLEGGGGAEERSELLREEQFPIVLERFPPLITSAILLVSSTSLYVEATERGGSYV
jgi:hypothetical protein